MAAVTWRGILRRLSRADAGAMSDAPGTVIESIAQEPFMVQYHGAEPRVEKRRGMQMVWRRINDLTSRGRCGI